ncbi:MAG: response regulator [Myxococcaceae bacterium]|nr:response regulator [Myxococcaceae bacterium]
MNAPVSTVLVVDDEPRLRRFLRASLEGHGLRVIEATTAREALSLASSHNPDVLILDLGLPDGDGLDVARRVREWSQLPIIVVSARGQELDKVAALDAGADDYLTKPFGTLELLARVRVALRHRLRSASGPPVTTYEFGDVHVDVARHEVTRGETQLHLTPTEFKLLVVLAQNAGKVLTHRFLLKEVWGPGSENQSHTLRVHMAELRKKVEAEPARPKWIVTETGVGYRLRDRQE